MALVDEINDSESLKAWLETQPKEIVVDIAHRAAMRVLPIYWDFASQHSELTALPALRANLINGVARLVPTPFISAAAAATARATAARATAAATDFATTATWAAVRFDAGQVEAGKDPLAAPLWPETENPLQEYWDDVQYRLKEDPNWSFWLRWYQAALEGPPLDPDLIKEIATQDDAFWDGPDAEVNRRIADVVERGGWRGLSASKADVDTTELLQQLSEVAKNAERSKQELEEQTEKAGDALTRLAHIEEELLKAKEASDALAKTFEGNRRRLIEQSEELPKQLQAIREDYEEKFKAALEQFTKDRQLEAPVVLWTEKQKEHEEKAEIAQSLFMRGLYFVGALAGSLLLALVFLPDGVAKVSGPVGCDPSAGDGSCSGFSFRGVLVTGAVFTILTIALWFTRLRMKEFLSERHLALDARERQAFALTYATLDNEVDRDQNKEERVIVYNALFRPTSDGIVKEEGGMDPAITAAVSKLLSRN